MRAHTNLRRLAVSAVVIGVTGLTVCSCSSSSQPAASSTSSQAAAAAGSGSTSSTTSGASAKEVDACTLVTPADLSQAVGVQYTAIQGSDGSFCNVTGANVPDSFFFIVNKEGAPPNTWDAQLAIIKRDDGSETSVSGVGDQAAHGAVKEFAAEAKGYIVLVTNADFNNPATASTFTRSKTIAQLLISKL